VQCLGRLRHAVGLGLPAPEELLGRVRDTAAALGVRPPTVCVLPGLGSPMVWGLGWPVLLWPQGLERRLPEDGLRAVLVHELAHLKRRDHWVGWLLLAGACLWWWLPLFGLVRRRLSLEAELACDAWVAATLPGARRAYAEALLEVCQARSQAAPAAPAWGAAGGRRDLERRLRMILNPTTAYRLTPRVLAGVGLLCLLALPAWSLGQGDGKDTPKGTITPTAKGTDKKTVEVQNLVEVAEGVTHFLAVADVPDTDHEKKIKALEDKVAALLKEIKALRGEAKPKPRPKTVDATLDIDADGIVTVNETRPAEITLTRKTYTLPAGKAEALAKFLGEHVKAPVLEVKSDKDHLTVTTTPEYQHAIGQLVDLVQGKAPKAHNRFGYEEKLPAEPAPKGPAPRDAPKDPPDPKSAPAP
jgi:hypothetical protein